MVSRLTLDALAVCARVRRVAGIVFFDCFTFKVFSAARASLGAKLHRWPGRARRELTRVDPGEIALAHAVNAAKPSPALVKLSLEKRVSFARTPLLAAISL